MRGGVGRAIRVSRVASLTLLCAVSVAADGATRRGWFDEPMPEGLERGSTHGEYLWSRDESVMVYVPAGSFVMGSDEGRSDEQPSHEVVLSGYYIDKYEVSWRQWKLSGLPYSEKVFSRRSPPEAPDWGIIDDHPVVSVDWDHAVAFAAWAGKRLPTEAEWEKAARGTDGRRYPWGDEPPNFDRAVWRYHPIAKVSTAPVDCCPEGASPYGAQNMAGNVYEWCQDTYQEDAYSTLGTHDPVARGAGPYRVLRGGAFLLELEDLRSALRYRLYTIDRTPYIGFRAALSAGGTEEAP